MEFTPQTRLLRFKGSLLNDRKAVEMMNLNDIEKTHSFSLALPYTVFIFKFVDGVFDQVKMAFGDRPLKKLQERPLYPYLPNIDGGLTVCLGSSFDEAQLEKGDLVQQANHVLSYFWQSVFKNESSTNYWDCKEHFENVDDRMSSLENWQEASFRDPLFVIDDVQWRPHYEETFGDVIVKMLHYDAQNVELNEGIYQEFVDQFLKEMKTAMDNAATKACDRISVSNFDDKLQEWLTR